MTRPEATETQRVMKKFQQVKNLRHHEAGASLS